MGINDKHTDIEKRFLNEIGAFYLDKYLTNDTPPDKFYKKHANALNAIHDLCITQVEVVEKDEQYNLIIRLHRPSVLIGEKGHNIKALEKYLSENFKKKVEIFIVEELLDDYLYPQMWGDDY